MFDKGQPLSDTSGGRNIMCLHLIHMRNILHLNGDGHWNHFFLNTKVNINSLNLVKYIQARLN